MIEVAWLAQYSKSGKTLYGSKAYEKHLLNYLSNNEDYVIREAYPHSNGTNGFLRWVKELYRLSGLYVYAEVLIRDFCSAAIMGKTSGRNIAVIHHLDSSQMKHPFINKLLERKIIANLGKIDTIVTVSEYWKRKFEKMGHNDVRVVYNGFDLTSFDITDEEVTKFKERYGLVKKPIIYLGNCQQANGVVEAYHALKKLNVHLVTSGEKEVNIPARHFNLTYKGYLTLLKASNVVIALSKFKEGWNRTVHEAMLCKTPVVGVAQGGMGELLNGGKQMIFSPNSVDWLNQLFSLSEIVEMAMAPPRNEKLGQSGYDYASQFTIERFEREWGKILNEWEK